jgi:3-hydroxyisobutyrate dehydrogenase-like beta-hydroxyacid dehydrogenase
LRVGAAFRIVAACTAAKDTAMPPTVAIIAQGAMGAGFGQRLTRNGVVVLTSLEGRSGASATRAAAAGMRNVPLPAIAEADIILSIIPPAEARALAERLAPHLAAASRKPLYADCNAISPATAEAVAGVIAAAGAPFADAGIIGGPPREDGYTPVLYTSGPGASALAALGAHGLDVRIVEGPVGAASALKMSYAGITKGLTALISAMSLAATRAGAAEGFFRELERSQPELLRWFQRFVPQSFDKAYRWNGEMEEIADYIGPGDGSSGGAAAGIYEAIAGFYTQMAADNAGPGKDRAAISAFLATPPR